MSNQDDNSGHTTYYNILEIYQKCRKNGDWAKVYLETRGGNEFLTISVNVSAGSTADSTSGMENRKEKKKKKPGQVRRDQRRRMAFLERQRQAARSAEAVKTNEIRNDEVEKSGEVDVKAGETSSEVGNTVVATSPDSSIGCTWNIGVEAPSPGSPQQSMSIDSASETENEDENTDKKKNDKWRIKVESEEPEKLEHHVKIERDSKVFKFKANREIFYPIMSVDSIVHQGNGFVVDVTIDDQFCIGFIENEQNWPTFVKNVKRISKLGE